MKTILLLSMWKKYGQRSLCRSICRFHVHVLCLCDCFPRRVKQWSSSKLTHITSCWYICRETVTSGQLPQLRCFLRKCCYKIPTKPVEGFGDHTYQWWSCHCKAAQLALPRGNLWPSGKDGLHFQGMTL